MFLIWYTNYMDSIKSLCSQISKESKCPLCKGSFHMDECQKCGYKSVLIKECIIVLFHLDIKISLDGFPLENL